MQYLTKSSWDKVASYCFLSAPINEKSAVLKGEYWLSSLSMSFPSIFFWKAIDSSVTFTSSSLLCSESVSLSSWRMALIRVCSGYFYKASTGFIVDAWPCFGCWLESPLPKKSEILPLPAFLCKSLVRAEVWVSTWIGATSLVATGWASFKIEGSFCYSICSDLFLASSFSYVFASSYSFLFAHASLSFALFASLAYSNLSSSAHCLVSWWIDNGSPPLLYFLYYGSTG